MDYNVDISVISYKMGSILDDASILEAKDLAIKMIEEVGNYVPELTLLFEDGIQVVMSFYQPPEDPDDRFALVQSTIQTFTQKHGALSEALYLAKALMVTTEVDTFQNLSERLSEDLELSKDPTCKEVLVIAGRNASASVNKTIGIPFTRSGKKIRWEEAIDTNRDSSHPKNFLDTLFSKPKKKWHLGQFFRRAKLVCE